MKSCLCLALLLIAALAQGQECKPTKIQVTKVDFEGGQKLSPAIKNEIVREIKLKIRNTCQLPSEMNERARDILQQHGYFKAFFKDSISKQIGGTKTNQQISVLLIVEEGAIYRLGHIEFAGNETFDSTKLRAAFPMIDGKTFGVEKVRAGMRNLRSLYCTAGYINLFPIPNSEINEIKKLVTIRFQIEEGVQYRVGKLMLAGEEPYAGAGKRLMEAWRPHMGQIYTCDPVGQPSRTTGIRKRNTQDIGVQDILSAPTFSSNPEISINEDSKTVDFHFSFPDPK